MEFNVKFIIKFQFKKQKSLRKANVSEVPNKTLEENTPTRQGNKKVIIMCKILGARKLGTFLNDYNQPILENYILGKKIFSIDIATGFYYEISRSILMQISCKRFILLLNISI